MKKKEIKKSKRVSESGGQRKGEGREGERG